ncbi:hypothetical protein Q4543_10030 [Salipiger sp. 1_MG-2023]|uniref:hypothetical protein n=1 Tax=Salipiger sp. 1_MG-2023 TaxID=3062665 RepID=UPI0026E2F0F2|nr:hypothetical protein [Salipiger sp. 1_MG-2023]MDO6585858.1 hypothetical protein [Salipiger sp. 1_MG-2023]
MTLPLFHPVCHVDDCGGVAGKAAVRAVSAAMLAGGGPRSAIAAALPGHRICAHDAIDAATIIEAAQGH